MSGTSESKVIIPQSTSDAMNGLKPFMVNMTLVSTAAATPIVGLADTALLSTQKAYISHFFAKVNGGTAWATTLTIVTIKDNAGNTIVTIPIANLTANAFIFPNTAGLTLASSFTLNTGGAAGSGLRVVGDANAGSGSDLVVTLFGYIR